MSRDVIKDIVNQRKTWIYHVSGTLNRLEDGTACDFPKIPNQLFRKADSKAKVRLLKSKIKDILQYSKVSLDGSLLCPFHNDRSPSMKYNKDKYDFHCFSCHDPGKTYDLFDLIATMYGLEKFAEQMQKAIDLLVTNADASGISSTKSKEGASNSYTNDNLNHNSKRFPSSTKKVYLPIEQDEECIKFLIQRGISIDTAKNFKLKCWNYRSNKYLIIPCDNNFFTRRKFVSGEGHFPKYWNKGEVSLFNGECLKIEDQIVFVVESTLCAMVLHELGYCAVAINGAMNFNLIISEVEVIRSYNVFPILMLDNDGGGISALVKLIRKLNELKIPMYAHIYEKSGIAAFLSEFKDISDAYMADPVQTEKALVELMNFLITPVELPNQSSQQTQEFKHIDQKAFEEMFGVAEEDTSIKQRKIK